MKLLFIILGIAITLGAIYHSVSTESKKNSFMQFCYQEHEAVWLNMKELVEMDCEYQWERFRQGNQSEAIKRWLERTS